MTVTIGCAGAAPSPDAPAFTPWNIGPWAGCGGGFRRRSGEPEELIVQAVATQLDAYRGLDVRGLSIQLSRPSPSLVPALRRRLTHRPSLPGISVHGQVA